MDMLKAQKVLNTSTYGLLGLLLAGSVGLGVPLSSEAKSSHKKHSSDNSQVAFFGLEKLGEGVSMDAPAEAGSGKSKTKIAKKDKEAKADKKSDSDSKDSKDKDAKDSKEAKADKKESNKKEDKSKDSDKKAEKGDAKAEAARDDKKGGGGFFHMGGNKKAEPPKKGALPQADQKAAKPVQEEDPSKPKYKFDPALISVLKDINKSLKDSEAVTKLEDPAQKLVAKLAGEALDKALTAPDLHANRILESKDKARMESNMSAEAWDSGVIEVSPQLKASVTALWAKKIEGLLTVQIVGEYNGNVDGTEKKLGEFIAVITAHSAVDKGFDIQSQQDVNFWIGKVVDLKIDCSSGKESAQSSNPETKSFLMLTSPITARKREFFAALKDWEEKKILAQKAEEEKKKQEELQVAMAAKQKEVAEALAQKVAEALMKSANKKPGEVSDNAGKDGGNDGEKKSDGSHVGGDAVVKKSVEGEGKIASAGDDKVHAPADQKMPAEPVKNAPQEPKHTGNPIPASGNGSSSANTSIASIFPEQKSSRSSWDSPAAPSSERAPSLNSTLVFPARVVAGQYMTVAVLNEHSQGEQFVGLSFNGAQLSTGENGKVVYQIPEDAPPGYSLSLSLPGRPEQAASAIEVLQPLLTHNDGQSPNVEAISPVVSGSGYLTVSGHNFDGIAERNRVIIDGAYDANVVVSSPVQIKAQVPGNIPAGQHSICVSTAGLRSNPKTFDYVTVDLSASGPDTPRNDLKKLLVKVQGTQNKVRVRLVNQSRDVIKMLKGDEVVVVTSGGLSNQIIVPVQRLRWGAYKINAEILI